MWSVENIEIKIIVIFLFSLVVDNYPKLNKYTEESKFNMHRSLLCLFICIYAFHNVINNLHCLSKPYDLSTFEFNDLIEWFAAYLFTDIIKMILINNKRIDLYIHHLVALLVLISGMYYDKVGLISSLALINEIISIVSGIDSIYLEDKNYKKSKQCKVFRKYVILFIRLPIWILIIGLHFYHYDSSNTQMFYLYLLFLISYMSFILLDCYWLKKCNKIINK